MLSIWKVFLSNHRQRVVVDGAHNEWILIALGLKHGTIWGPLLFILYASEMFELMENRLLTQMIPHYLQLVGSQ